MNGRGNKLNEFWGKTSDRLRNFLHLDEISEKLEPTKQKIGWYKIFRDEEEVEDGFDKPRNKFHQLLDSTQGWRTVRSWTAEIAGDVMAVPATVITQRIFPSLFQGIRNLTEPLLGPLYEKSTARAARKWAEKKGLAADAQEAQAYQKEMYEYEAAHLPHALMWSGYSMFLNAGAQKAMGNKHKFMTIATTNTWSILTTLTGVMAIRVIFPAFAAKWDEWTGKNVFKPITKRVAKIFGVEEKDIDAEQSAESKAGWARQENEKDTKEPKNQEPAQESPAIVEREASRKMHASQIAEEPAHKEKESESVRSQSAVQEHKENAIKEANDNRPHTSMASWKKREDTQRAEKEANIEDSGLVPAM